MENLERLSESQQYLYNKVALGAKKRARVLLQRAELTKEQKKKLQSVKELLHTDATHPILNIDLQKVFPTSNKPVIDHLFKTGRFLNRFEFEVANDTKLGATMQSRIMEEFLLYGATFDLIRFLSTMPNVERPNYAAMDFIGSPNTLPMLGYYGKYRFRLKKEVFYRSTFSPGSVSSLSPEDIFTWETIQGALLHRFPVGKDTVFLFEHIHETVKAKRYLFQFMFIELQILGGISLEKDVEVLYYPSVDQYTNFFEKLKGLSETFSIELHPY